MADHDHHDEKDELVQYIGDKLEVAKGWVWYKVREWMFYYRQALFFLSFLFLQISFYYFFVHFCFLSARLHAGYPHQSVQTLVFGVDQCVSDNVHSVVSLRR